MLEADELDLASLAAGGLLVLLALVVLVGGSLPGQHGGHDLTTMVIRLHPLRQYSRHRLGSVALPQTIRQLGQLIQAGQLGASQVHLDSRR